MPPKVARAADRPAAVIVQDPTGLRVHYRLHEGAGRPLVFVHGYCCSADDWALQVSHFAGRHAVLTPDLPGHGRSETRPDAWTIERCSTAIGATLVDAEIRGGVLVGHSLGCRVALQTALNHADRVAGVVLVDGSWVGSGSRESAERAAAERIGAVGGRQWIEQSFAVMFLPGADEDLRRRLTERARDMPAEAATRLLPSMFGWDAACMESALRSLTVPVLALQSTDLDEALQRVTVESGAPTRWLATLARNTADLTVEVVPCRSHFPMIERADEVNAAIDRFSDRLGTSPAPPTTLTVTG